MELKFEYGSNNEPFNGADCPDEIWQEALAIASYSEILPNGLPALASLLYKASQEDRVLRIKLGVDPTSSDLHLGHTVCLNKLKRFQDYGHQVVLIIGGFTAQIGDPSGRNVTRPALTPEQVAEYARTYIDQVALILDINKTEIVNNASWLSPLTLNEIIKLASTITVNQLLAKEAFGTRLDKQQPLAFHELFYPLLQAYDSVAIRADIEMGGTDQRFNILQGRELQGKLGMRQQLAMLLPLLEGTCGQQKMSKSFDNYIALKHPPQEMFGRCMRLNDELILKFLELTTQLSTSDLEEHKDYLTKGGNPMKLKQVLGYEIVKLYHGESDAKQVLDDWTKVHSLKQAPSCINEFTVSHEISLLKILVQSKLVASSTEAKRLIQMGAVRLNGSCIKDMNYLFTAQSLEPESILQIGRRKFLSLVFSENTSSTNSE